MSAAELPLAAADLSRVTVVGTSCAGKSTFARGLSRILDIPCTEIDALYWLPDWQTRDRAELRALVDEAVDRPRWVLDGNYGSLRDLIWPRATAVIWLNYAFATVCRRALARTLRRSIDQESPFPGSRESVARSFLSRESILLRVIRSYPQRQRQYRAVFDGNDFPHLSRIEFRTCRSADAALQKLESTSMEKN